MKNQRQLFSPPTKHSDFEWIRGMPVSARTEDNKNWLKLKTKIDNNYFDFAVCFWGNVGSFREPDSSAPGNVFYIKQNVPFVKEVFENIDYSDLHKLQTSVGAAQLTSDMMIDFYQKTKQRIGK